MNCQLHSVPEMAAPIGMAGRLWQLRNRANRILKRRAAYLRNFFRKQELLNPSAQPFQPGDVVRVRSREEIQGTLNQWNQFKGCSFMEEMRPFCDTTQRVLKRVEKFLDERDYLLKKCKGIVILDGVFCEGTKDFGPCDRSCFYFWREEWLEKLQ